MTAAAAIWRGATGGCHSTAGRLVVEEIDQTRTKGYDDVWHEKMTLRRWALLPVAVLVLVLGIGTPAGASGRDWRSGTITESHVRSADSHVSGGRAFLTIAWAGYRVDIDGFVRDTAKDGYGVTMQLRYSVYTGGRWHTHEVFIGQASGRGHTDWFGPYRNVPPMRGVVERACRTHRGDILRCDTSWR